jgi:hypothetical protein
MKFQFSGHDSFICKHFWLKKGFDFVQNKGSFTDDEKAVVELGVGKNMVTAINYWLKAFDIFDSLNKPTEFGTYIFNKRTGVDPYVENLGTIWLLHYYLVKTGKASIYSLFFNEFRKGKFEFTKDQLIRFVNRKLEGADQKSLTQNTLVTDISVFIRNYLKPDYKGNKIDVEDDFANLLIDLELMTNYQSENAEGKEVEWYKVQNEERIDLPYQIVLFAILDNADYGNSISFRELLGGFNSPGSVFAINESGLYSKLEEITSNNKKIIYTESAGIRELQFKSKPNKWDVLNEYYNK